MGIINFSPQADYSEMKLYADYLYTNGGVYGWVHHDWGDHRLNTPSDVTCGCGYPYLDTNGCFIMHTYRHYLWTGNTSRFNTLWPDIKDAISALRQWDNDTAPGDYLPDDQ